MRNTQGTFSFLPDFTDEQVQEEVALIKAEVPQVTAPQMPPFDSAQPVSEDGTDGGSAAV